MYKYVSVRERKFKVVRICREEFTTDEVKESIKQQNSLIDVVLSDGKGSLFFCHEMKDAQFREPTEEVQQEQ
jgi:hypothetical protein